MDRLNFAAELCQHRNNTVGCGIRFLMSESQPLGAQLKALRFRIGRARAEVLRRRGGMGKFACGVEVIPATGLVGWKR
ncbi:MAG: hypothetical protein ACOX52_08485 [Verrucomicrobiota bacterium]